MSSEVRAFGTCQGPLTNKRASSQTRQPRKVNHGGPIYVRTNNTQTLSADAAKRRLAALKEAA